MAKTTTESSANDAMKDGKKTELGMKFLKVVCSNLALFVIVVGITALGGFVFKHLESENEEVECVQRQRQYIQIQNKTLRRLYSISTQGLEEYDTMSKFVELLQDFRNEVMGTDYDGTNCTLLGKEGGKSLRWSWAGSTMFAMTVVTTIGKYVICFLRTS